MPIPLDGMGIFVWRLNGLTATGTTNRFFRLNVHR
jgi:hypothetical protein